MISTDNLFRWWGEGHFAFYREWTGPFLRAYEQQRSRRPQLPWPWDLESAVNGSLDRAWDMTGKWRARRAVAVDRRRFNAEVPRIVATLSLTLNKHGIQNMHHVCELNGRDSGAFGEVVGAIHDAIKESSSIKPTAVIKPMFGSKVLHHFFPSVVPVFDSAYVLNGAMKSDDYQQFQTHESVGWKYWSYQRDGAAVVAEAELDDYHDYLDYCLARLSVVDPSDLRDLRGRFSDVLGSSVSTQMRSDRSSLLWQLDAKIAEWCLCGSACAEGTLR